VRRRKKPGSIKWLLKILTLLLVLFSAYSFIHSDFFAVASIKVSGTKLVSQTEIVALSGLAKGENIFKIDPDEAEKKIGMHAMVASTKVEKRMPRAIEIIVEEKVPVALIPIAGGLLQIDGEGFVLRKENQLSKESLPIITGLNLPETFSIGEKINSENLTMGLKMVSQMDEAAKKEIAEINVSDPQRLRAFTIQGAEIRLGNADGFQEKFSKFLQVMKEEQKLDRLDNIEYIDVSFSGRPVVFYRK
jgi:cell division protein FtsQ